MSRRIVVHSSDAVIDIDYVGASSLVTVRDDKNKLVGFVHVIAGNFRICSGINTLYDRYKYDSMIDMMERNPRFTFYVE